MHSFNCDISDEASVNETFTKIKQSFKTVHILINNAGVLTKGSIRGKIPLILNMINELISEGPMENLKTTLDVNVIGLLRLTKETFTLMKESGVEDGHIININRQEMDFSKQN